MKTISIDEVQPSMKIASVGNTAMYLNLCYGQVVEVLLETHTDFTDFDIIAEVIDTMNLDIICVADPMPHGKIIYGYINNDGVKA